MDADIKARLCKQTVKVRRVTLSESGASETLGTTTEISAYVEKGHKTVPGKNGGWERVPYTLVVFDAADYSITDEDRMWLPGLDATDPDKGLTPDGIERFYDEDQVSLSHYEVSL